MNNDPEHQRRLKLNKELFSHVKIENGQEIKVYNMVKSDGYLRGCHFPNNLFNKKRGNALDSSNL